MANENPGLVGSACGQRRRSARVFYFNNGPNQRILAGTSSEGGSTEDSICNTTGAVPVQRHALWFTARFQRLMDQVLRGLDEIAAAYLDDVIVFSPTWKEHLEHLRKVMDRLRDAGLTVKLKKCQFGMDHCVYLGQWRSLP